MNLPFRTIAAPYYCETAVCFRRHFPVRYSRNEISQLQNQPMGTAHHTIKMPNRGAIVTATITRILRFTRLATVNIFISPAPRSKPSTAILKPMKQKNHPIKVRK